MRLDELLPTPCASRRLPGVWRPDRQAALLVHGDADDRRSAALLAERFGLARPRMAPGRPHMLTIGTVAVDAPPAHPEGYLLRVTGDGVLLAGHDATGLFRAVQTLLKLADAGAVPGVEIRDWPATAVRAVMVDVGRQVETVDWLEGLIGRLAAYGVNLFVLYLEDKFRWRSHPGLAHPEGYSAADLRRLARAAASNRMELVPALPSLGHCEGILQHDEIAHLREDGAIYQLSLRHPGTRRLLTDLYGELLTLCPGAWFHVNCDESPLLAGPPGSPPSYLQESLRLFRDHLVFLHGLLARHGRRMQMWGDMLLHHPEIMQGLPRDIVIVDWDYGRQLAAPRAATAQLMRAGFPVIVAPAAVRSAQMCYPDALQLDDNIPAFIRAGAHAGALGSMNTLWELFGTSSRVAWPGLVVGAQCAWAPEAIPPAHLRRRVCAHLYGRAAAPLAAAGQRALSSHAFKDRMMAEAATPAGRRCRTYHVDSHEFAVSDPIVHLTWRRHRWAEGIRARMTAGRAALADAIATARRGRDDLKHASLAGLHQLFQADKRCAINEAAAQVLAAERARRAGRLALAGERLRAADAPLTRLAGTVRELIAQTPAFWAATKPGDAPGLDDGFMDRLRLARDGLRGHRARLSRAATRLERGLDADLSAVLGCASVLCLELNNAAELYDIFLAGIAGADRGGPWTRLGFRNWYVLGGQGYVTALALRDGWLPQRLRVHVRRTHINPAAYPLAERLSFSAARTLTPGEILDRSVEADLDTPDWRLLRLPAPGYRLTRAAGWVLEYARTDGG